jgi:hypothetical protein
VKVRLLNSADLKIVWAAQPRNWVKWGYLWQESDELWEVLAKNSKIYGVRVTTLSWIVMA